MHEPVVDRLEDYLQGKACPEVDRHLSECKSCREMVDQMRQQAMLLQALRPPVVEPSPGFYGRVMGRIESQARPSVWNLFGESLFAQRLTYASLTLLVLLGMFLVTIEQSYQEIGQSAPETIFASEEEQPIPVETDPQRGRDSVLVTLTTYQGY